MCSLVKTTIVSTPASTKARCSCAKPASVADRCSSAARSGHIVMYGKWTVAAAIKVASGSEEDAQALLAQGLPVEHDAALAQAKAFAGGDEPVGACAAELLLHVPAVLQEQEVAARDDDAVFLALRIDELHEVAQARRRPLDP